MSSGLDPATMQNELSRLVSNMAVNPGIEGAHEEHQGGRGTMNPPPLSQVNSNTMGAKMQSMERGAQKKRGNMKVREAGKHHHGGYIHKQHSTPTLTQTPHIPLIGRAQGPKV